MRLSFTSTTRLFCLCAAALLLSTTAARPQTGEMKLEAKLIWGTNDDKSPDPKHKPVPTDLAQKLKSSPFKWANYFEVNDKQFTLGLSAEKLVSMSKNCDIKVKNLGDSQVELCLFGKGKLVSKITQALPKGQLLVTGGNAENATAWFVVLKQTD
jgi:hypothetical protein